MVELFAVPNPDPRSLAVLVEGGPDTVELKLYSAAMVCVARESLELKQGWNAVPGALGLSRLSSGFYYVEAKALSGSKAGTKLCKVVVLR